jgi:hypothetical protein
MHEYRTLKPVEVVLIREMGKRENNGGDEPILDTSYAYMEMSQCKPLYNYYVEK